MALYRGRGEHRHLPVNEEQLHLVLLELPEGEVAETLKTARRNGKFVVGMKIFGAGELVAQEQRDASLRYVWGNKLVDAMTIGFEKPAQVDDTINHLNRVLRS